MTYLTPTLQPCTSAEWARHFRDPQNAHLALAAVGKAEVVTSWVGLVVEGEPPRPFLVRLRRRAKAGWRDVESWWHTTREGALARHQDLVDGLLCPTGR